MQIRIMMLLSDEKNKRLCGCAETILEEVAGSFGHSFSIRYEQIGAASRKLYGEALTEETVDACLLCKGVVADSICAEGMNDLTDALSADMCMRNFALHKNGSTDAAEVWLANVQALDEESVRKGAEFAFRAAEKMALPVYHIAPSGKARETWDAAVCDIAKEYTYVSHAAIEAEAAMTMMLKTPEDMGVMLLPPYAGRIFQAAADAMCADPYMMHALMPGKETGVYAACYQREDGEMPLSPVAIVMAVAKMLRFSCDLEKEADCVDAAVHNVLAAGWRTPDMPLIDEDQVITPEDMADLICEQIALAGQLLYDGKGVIL